MKCLAAAVWLLGVAVLTACTSSPADHHQVSGHRAAEREVQAARPLTRADVMRCPRTVPGRYPHEQMPKGPGALRFPTTPTTAVLVFHHTRGTFAFGNGRLWTILDRRGLLVASGDMVRPDGSIWWKFPWWRLVAGQLSITGKRLEARAPPLTSRVPNGYGNIGFQASGVIFPTEGCWQITAKTAQTSLTFVAFVITKARAAALMRSS